jgi:hypothetical protein
MVMSHASRLLLHPRKLVVTEGLEPSHPFGPGFSDLCVYLNFHHVTKMVWETGFEPATSCAQGTRSTKLSYTQMKNTESGWSRTNYAIYYPAIAVFVSTLRTGAGNGSRTRV